MDEEAQPAHGGAPLQHGHEPVSPGVLQGAAQVEAVGLQQQTLGRDGQAAHGIVLFHVQHVGVVDQQLVRQAEIVAVGVKLGRVIGLDDDIPAQVFLDFLS